jgi:hypothetical protein
MRSGGGAALTILKAGRCSAVEVVRDMGLVSRKSVSASRGRVMALRRIRLELARHKDFPNGSAHHGYEIVAPLLADGHLDAQGWRNAKDKCRVRRFWNGEPDLHGFLVHRGGGWAFDYDKSRSDDDERVFKLDRHSMAPGDYVSVTEQDGVQRTFRVARVDDTGPI